MTYQVGLCFWDRPQKITDLRNTRTFNTFALHRAPHQPHLQEGGLAKGAFLVDCQTGPVSECAFYCKEVFAAEGERGRGREEKREAP